MFTSRFDDAMWLGWALASGQISKDVFDMCVAGIHAGVPQGLIVEADYAAIEVVALCAFSKDTALTKALLDGIDMHCLRLSGALKEPYESVLLKCKDETHPEHLAYSIKRTLIKPKAFAYQYGATAFGIAFATGCTVEEAQEFIDTEKATFPEVESFYDDQITPVVIANTVQHREQADDGSWHMYGRGHWQSPGGTCYSFRQYESNVKDEATGKWRKQMAYKPTQIRNYPIQGESGFFMQGMTGKIIRWLVACDFFGGLVHAINTVHDCVVLDCHKSVLDVVCTGVKAIMESLPQHFNENFGYDLHVPFPVSIEVGRSMGDLHKWVPGEHMKEVDANVVQV
jgi:DNA polymerase I-like protein with 3'-5' exonuclease and polymerase domains